jgi:plastocyanin
VFRLARRAAPLAIMLAMLIQTDALAATSNVTIANFSFTPNLSKLKMGDTVHWTNNGPSSHTTTSNSPLVLWDSGTLGVGATFDFTFTAAGIYPYHCSIHPSMTANAGSKDQVTPPSGPVGTVFTVKVATVTAPAGFVYDVQKKNPGGNFQNFAVGITTMTTMWDSTGQATGVYQFRSRLRRTSDGAASGFSPGQNVTVT